ncbi:conserved hypothetical protein [Vibrio chagasii]|nr:conserved hypothetical protein [Vibrio chagasii]
MSIDQRIIELGIEVEGKITWYKDLYIEAKGSKHRNINDTQCVITVYNLPANTRNYILDNAFAPGVGKDISIQLKVGRESYGASLMFSGEVDQATQSGLPDIALMLRCHASYRANKNTITISGGEVEPLTSIAKKAADALGVALNFGIDDKNIASFSYAGKDSGLLNALQSLIPSDSKVVVDGGTLFFTKSDSIAQGFEVADISVGYSGLIEATGAASGVKIKSLYSPSVQLMGGVNLLTSKNPNLNGRYALHTLTFDVSNSGTPFYLNMEGVKLNG